MTWAVELKKIRRLLRDPNSNIWSEQLLKNMFNDVQKDFQHKTSILEDAAVQRIPGLYHFAYMYDWEYRFLPTQFSIFFQCLQQHDEGVFCHRWETQETTGIAADVSDYGIHFTQPWEAFMGQVPADVLKNKFPGNLRNLKFIAYDEEPIYQTTKKKVQTRDASHITVSGQPFSWYEYSDLDDSYVLYPRPATAFVDELDGNEGPAWYIESDTEDVTTGTISVRTGSFGSDNVGAAVDIIDTVNNVFMIYDVEPVDIAIAWDEGDYPEFLKKYIRYGVISRAYGANTDGNIPSLAEYWQFRYQAGVKHTKKYRRNRKQDRDYRLITDRVMVGRRHRHPHLPDGYPSINP